MNLKKKDGKDVAEDLTALEKEIKAWIQPISRLSGKQRIRLTKSLLIQPMMKVTNRLS